MGLPTEAGDIIASVAYNAAAQRWYWLTGSGHSGFVAQRFIRDEMLRHQEAMVDALKALTGQLYGGEMSVAEWEAAVAVEIKNASLAQAALAQGGFPNMGAAEYGRVGQMLREQYGFLGKFAEDIATTGISEGQAVVRAGMYGDATEQAYWDAWRAAHAGAEGLEDLPLLRQSPRDGGTQCLTNCQCELVENDDGSVDWELGVAEHCADCEELAAGGPYRVG